MAAFVGEGMVANQHWQGQDNTGTNQLGRRRPTNSLVAGIKESSPDW